MLASIFNRQYARTKTYAFNPGQLLSCAEIRQQGIFPEGRRKDASALVEGNAAAGIDWLDRVLRLKSCRILRFVCHCGEQE